MLNDRFFEPALFPCASTDECIGTLWEALVLKLLLGEFVSFSCYVFSCYVFD